MAQCFKRTQNREENVKTLLGNIDDFIRQMQVFQIEEADSVFFTCEFHALARPEQEPLVSKTYTPELAKPLANQLREACEGHWVFMY